MNKKNSISKNLSFKYNKKTLKIFCVLCVGKGGAGGCTHAPRHTMKQYSACPPLVLSLFKVVAIFKKFPVNCEY